MKNKIFSGLAIAAGLMISQQASAATITNGFTYAVASGSSDTSVGTHYHSNTGGAFGNPAGKAEVGRYSSEEVRGLSEYDLSSLSTATSAYVTFSVYDNGGLFAGVNDYPFSGNITIEAYQGNNSEDISDYQAAATATVGSFSTGFLTVGGVLSFDITSIFNDSISNGFSSLGMRLRVDPLNSDGGAWTFDQFKLTTDDQGTISPVPLPAGLPLLVTGILGFGVIGRRKKAA